MADGLTVHLVWISGDHALHVHPGPDVRLLVHQRHGGLVPGTRPLQAVVVGAGGQVQVERHGVRTGAESIEVQTYLHSRATRRMKLPPSFVENFCTNNSGIFICL